MMRQARQQKFDVVLVWKFDRFARSTAHLPSALQELGYYLSGQVRVCHGLVPAGRKGTGTGGTVVPGV